MKEKFKTENVEDKAQNAFIAFLSLLLFRKTIKYYSFRVDIIPKMGYPIEESEV